MQEAMDERMKDREDSKLNDPQGLPTQGASACGPGCGCHATRPSSRIRWVIGIIVLVVAGVLVARAMVKDAGPPANKIETGFASALSPITENPSASPANDASMLGKEIGGLSELNTVAVSSDAVFVFLPGKDAAAGKASTAEIQGAARTIESKGSTIGLFTLKPGSVDYARVSAQVATPGVLAMVKGRGMSAVSGEITQAKLVQAFVSASSAGGGCGPASGCGPSSAGCGPRR